jgi:proline-specific peptidase
MRVGPEVRLSRRELLGGALAAVPAVALAQGRVWAPPEPDRELRVRVRGGSIYVRVNGDLSGARAPILCIHGGPGSNHGYLTSLLPMIDERAVILYDQLDAGLSDRPNDPANWTVERFVSEIDAIRAALDLTRLHVFGSSWGGTIALEYAARQPSGLRSLTLSGPLISTRSWRARTEAQLGTLPPAVRRTIDAHERAGTTQDPAYARAMDVFYSHFTERASVPAYLVEYEAQRKLKGNGVVYRGMWGSGEIRATGSLRDYNGEKLLPQIAVPTLVICGEYDEFTPAAAAPLARKIPRATLVSVPNAGHVAMLDESAFFLRALRDHLSRADRAA